MFCLDILKLFTARGATIHSTIFFFINLVKPECIHTLLINHSRILQKREKLSKQKASSHFLA